MTQRGFGREEGKRRETAARPPVIVIAVPIAIVFGLAPAS